MATHITITLIDQIHCKISGLEQEHNKLFYDAYAIKAPNYWFNPKYQLGSWDGKIRYYYADGSTYIGLLEQIVPKLTALDYEIEIEDQRPKQRNTLPENASIDKNIFSNYKWPDTDEPVVLYDHQVRVANTLLDRNTGIAEAATGAGKSLICAAIAQTMGEYNLRTMIIVPSTDLVSQTRTDFLNVGVDCGEYSGDDKDTDHVAVMSTWQALKNNPNVIKDFDCIIVDEVHLSKEQSVIQKLLSSYGQHAPYRYGVTGTVPKEETHKMSLFCNIGKRCIEVTAKELQDVGILAKLEIQVLQTVEDFSEEYHEHVISNPVEKLTYTQFKDQYFPDYQTEKTYTKNKEQRTQFIASTIEEAALNNGNTFVLVDGVQYGKKLADRIPNAMFLHGKDKKHIRKEIYDKFKDNDNLIVIANVQIAGTGLNIKRIYNLFLVDIGRSFTRVIQSIGRGLRVAEDKDHVDVYDVCSDLKYSKGHLRDRKKYYREKEYPFKVTKVNYN